MPTGIIGDVFQPLVRQQIEFAAADLAQQFGDGDIVHQAVIPVADALDAAAVRLKAGGDVGFEAFQHHRQRFGFAFARPASSRRNAKPDAAVADAVPVERALEPPVFPPVCQIRLEDVALDFLAHPLPDFRREVVAEQVDRLRQRRARLRREQVDAVRLARERRMRAERLIAHHGRVDAPVIGSLLLVRGQHPRRFLADRPEQVLQRVEHGQHRPSGIRPAPAPASPGAENRGLDSRGVRRCARTRGTGCRSAPE